MLEEHTKHKKHQQINWHTHTHLQNMTMHNNNNNKALMNGAHDTKHQTMKGAEVKWCKSMVKKRMSTTTTKQDRQGVCVAAMLERTSHSFVTHHKKQ